MIKEGKSISARVLRQRMYIAYLITVILATLVTSCGNTDNDTIRPLPAAWPRISLTHSDSMTVLKDLPVDISINPAASHTVLETDPPGLTVTYPGAHAQIFFTFIPSGKDDEHILEARKQRIALNLNGVKADTRHYESPTADTLAVMVYARGATQFPAQMLVNTPKYIVSATAFVNTPVTAANYDSIRPLFDVIQKDLATSIANIIFDSPKQP